MSIVRSFRYRLSPDAECEKLFWQFAGVCRLVYNLALEQRITWGKKHRIGYNRQSADLPALRSEFDWIKRVNSSCQQQALRDLDKAFANFYAGKGFPTPRKRGSNDSFRFTRTEFQVRVLNAKWAEVRLAKIGWVKFRLTRSVPRNAINATIRHVPDGWFVSFACELDVEAHASCHGSVGIDRGVVTTLALSNGETLSIPASVKAIEQRKRKAQRIVARRKKGSARRRRAQKRVVKLQCKQVRIRRDFHHRAALSIAQRFGVAVLENLSTRSMTASARGTKAEPGKNVRQKSGLNHSIMSAGWHQFAAILSYKMNERGGHIHMVPARHTSQT